MASFEVQEHQAGPEGLIVVAKTWHGLVLARELATSWPFMTQAYRRDQAEGWIDVNAAHPEIQARDREELIRALAAPVPDTDHPLWQHFESTLVVDVVSKWSATESWCWATDPRPAAPDQEVVLLFDPAGAELETLSDGRTVIPYKQKLPRYMAILMDHAGVDQDLVPVEIGGMTNRWRVAGFELQA